MSHYEDFARTHAVEVSSERAFGLVVGSALALCGVLPLLRGHTLRPLPLAAASLLVIAALARPRLLRVPNLLWDRFGRLLQRFTNPIFLGLVFFGILTPIAVVLRVLGKGMSSQRRSSNASYWKKPTASHDMRHQF